MGLDLGQMPLDQVRECFRAFLGGVASLYMFIYADMQELTEEEAMSALKDVEDQITVLLKQEVEFDSLKPQRPMFPDNRTTTNT